MKMTRIEDTILKIHSYRCQIRHATRDLLEDKDELDLELDRLHFMNKNTAQSKAYAKELRSDILKCKAFIGRYERAMKRLRCSLECRGSKHSASIG